MKKIVLLLAVLAVLGGLGWKGMQHVQQDFPRFCEETVPIFAYHRVEPGREDRYTLSPAQFDAQMKYLKDQGWTSISVEDYAKGRKEGRTFHKQCILLFDDGYLDNLTYAAPIMKKYGFTGNTFVAVKFEGWPGYLDWYQSHALLQYGWKLGSHTYNHEPLTTLSKEQVDYELARSMEHMKGIYNPEHGMAFSYPNGESNAAIAQQVQKAGYCAAISGNLGVNTTATPLWQLRRVNVFRQHPENLECFKKEWQHAQILSYIATTGIDTDWLLQKAKWLKHAARL